MYIQFRHRQHRHVTRPTIHHHHPHHQIRHQMFPSPKLAKLWVFLQKKIFIFNCFGLNCGTECVCHDHTDLLFPYFILIINICSLIITFSPSPKKNFQFAPNNRHPSIKLSSDFRSFLFLIFKLNATTSQKHRL